MIYPIIAKINTKLKSDTETSVSLVEYQAFTGKRKSARSIQDFIKNLDLLDSKDIRVYVYDLKECGEHIMYALESMGYSFEHLTGRDFPVIGQYTALINSTGEWYYIRLTTEEKTIEFRETKKLVPISLDAMREAFCEDEDADEIEVQLRALSEMYAQGLSSITIGAACLKEYKESLGAEFYQFFPHLDDELFDFFEESYRGGWVYCPEIKTCGHGYTLDENSLYPYVMRERDYPVGQPKDIKDAKHFQEILESKSKYAFVRFSVKSFSLKNGALPFIEIKGDMRYAMMGPLKDSRFMGLKGLQEPTSPIEMTMTETDYKLFIKYYDIKGFRFLSGKWMYTMPGIYLFGPYIDKWYGVKMRETGGKRQIAKLMLNNLGGKFAASKESSYKEPVLKKNGSFTYIAKSEAARKTLYIPVGCAMTAYAREVTIEAAIKNREIFRYSDTDSCHFECESLEDIKGLEIDSKKLGYWKIESEWESAKFLRAKAYIEKDIEKGYLVKCAGLGDACKEKVTERFETGELTYKDFDFGFTAPGAIAYRHIKGGCVRIERDFTLLENALERI